MADLQRSVTSFRRHGSSGLVWDDKFDSGVRDLNQTRPNQEDNEREEARELRQSQSVGSVGMMEGSLGMMERSQSVGPRPYRTVRAAPPSKDPPSPKLATCGLFCGLFGKPVVATHQSKFK